MKPVEVLYSILCCVCLPCRRKTRGFGDKSKKARSTEVYNDRKVDMEKVYARLRKKRVAEVPSVFEIFPCQWNPESASRIKDSEKSVDYPLKDGCAQVGVFGRFKVQNVAEEIPPLVAPDGQLPAQARNRRKRRQKKHEQPLDVYARLRKKRVAEVPSVFEIFPCQWNPESASRIKDSEKSVDYPLKDGCAQVGVFGRFKVQNVAEEIPPLVAPDGQLPAQARNRRKRRQKKHEQPLDVDFTWDFGEEEVAGDIPRSEDHTCEMCAEPEIFAMKAKIELQDAPQEGRTEIRVIGRFNVTVVPEEIPPIQDDDCKVTVEAEITAKEPETEFVDPPREDPVEVDPADKQEPRGDSEEGAAKDPSSLASGAAPNR